MLRNGSLEESSLDLSVQHATKFSVYSLFLVLQLIFLSLSLEAQGNLTFDTMNFMRQGDLTGDCLIDGSDIVHLYGNFEAQPAELAQGDLNEDGQVDRTDLELIFSYFGGSIGRCFRMKGDINADCLVDGLDYLIMTENYNHPDARLEEGDVTGDGRINGSDFISMFSNFGPLNGCQVEEPETGWVGDMDKDGDVDVDDLVVFDLALNSPEEYTREYQLLAATRGDTDGDDLLDESDLDGLLDFVEGKEPLEQVYGCIPHDAGQRHSNAAPGSDFSLTVQWDKIADADYDGRSVTVELIVPDQSKTYIVGESTLLSSCMQPDANPVYGIGRPYDKTGCGLEVVSNETVVQLKVTTSGGLHFAGWEECPGAGSSDESGSSSCSAPFGAFIGKSLQVKVKSDGLNFGEPWGNPSCPAGEPDCWPFTCEREVCEAEVLGSYDSSDGLEVLEAYAPVVPVVTEISLDGLRCVSSGRPIYVTHGAVHADIILRMKLSNGRQFVGTAKEIAQALSIFLRYNVKPRDVLALIGAGSAAKTAATGAAASLGSGTATVVSGATAACWVAGGLVLVTEVAILGWEVYDISSSAHSYCQSGGTLGGFIEETCSNYWTYHWGNPANWCWGDFQ